MAKETKQNKTKQNKNKNTTFPGGRSKMGMEVGATHAIYSRKKGGSIHNLFLCLTIHSKKKMPKTGENWVFLGFSWSSFAIFFGFLPL